MRNVSVLYALAPLVILLDTMFLISCFFVRASVTACFSVWDLKCTPRSNYFSVATMREGQMCTCGQNPCGNHACMSVPCKPTSTGASPVVHGRKATHKHDFHFDSMHTRCSWQDEGETFAFLLLLFDSRTRFCSTVGRKK